MRSVKSEFVAAAAALLAVAAAAPGARAGIVFFNDPAAFSAAAGAPTFAENFQGFAVDTPFRTAPLAIGGGTIVQEGIDGAFRNQVDVLPLEFPPAGGSSAGSLFTDAPTGAGAGTQVRITFAQLTTALGFDVFDAASGEGVVLEVFSGTTLLGTSAPFPNNGFVGFVTTAGDTATSARFRSVLSLGGGEGFYIDNLVGVSGAAAIPEPGSMALLAAGAVGLAGRRLVRRRAAA